MVHSMFYPHLVYWYYLFDFLSCEIESWHDKLCTSTNHFPLPCAIPASNTKGFDFKTYF